VPPPSNQWLNKNNHYQISLLLSKLIPPIDSPRIWFSEFPEPFFNREAGKVLIKSLVHIFEKE
jgi:hypothetical protein